MFDKPCVPRTSGTAKVKSPKRRSPDLKSPVVMLALSLLASTGCTRPAVAVEPDIPQKLITEIDALAIAIRQKSSDGSTGAAAHAREDRAALAQFYAERGGKPAWVEAFGLTARARDVVAEIRRAGEWGLQASAFELPELAAAAGTDSLAAADVKLSLAVVKYARHARGGRFNPSDLTKNLDVTPQLYDPKSVLASMAETDGPAAYLRRLHPKHPQFEKLRQIYLEQRAGGRGEGGRADAAAPSRSQLQVEQAESPQIQLPAGPRLRPGQSHPLTRATSSRS